MSDDRPACESSSEWSEISAPSTPPTRRTPGFVCDGCNYPLWQIRDRRCPECGREFLPSDYDFVPGTVAFACPHCDQPYFGKGTYGRLEPFVFGCVNCGRRIHMDQAVLTPAPGVDPARTVVGALPWLDRARIGRFTAWRRTLSMALFHPDRLARSIPINMGAGPGVWFGILTFLLYILVLIGPLMPFIAMMAPGGGGAMALRAVMPLLVFATAVLALIPLWGLVAHLTLAITGPRAAGPGRTMAVLGFASACAILAAIPCFGIYLMPIALIWPVISGTIMLMHTQRVGWFRALLAAGSVPLLLFVASAAMVIFPMILVTRGMAQMSVNQSAAAQARLAAAAAGTLPPSASPSTFGVGDGLRTFLADHGRWPTHALEAIEANAISATTLCLPDATIVRQLGDVPAGGTSLDKFVFLEKSVAQRAIERAAGQLPPTVTSHRLGDFVFTYHGIDPKGDGRLWIAVCRGERMPRFPIGTMGRGLVAAQLDGTIHNVNEADVAQALRDQNAIRAENGLPPLPDPADVTHETRATSTDQPKEP
ncbi:MAG: hypothetical protein ACKVW3_17345 [Phycisphaerales bacterium]